MKSAKRRAVKVDEPPMKHKTCAGRNKDCKCENRSRGQCLKTTVLSQLRKMKDTLLENEKNQALCLHLSGNGRNFAETTKTLPVPKHCNGKALNRSTKIKLQLFPVDEGTRSGLEKDGHHPYLELTLSSQKKISSVLKHLKGKWGGSSIAVGEPFLLPFCTCEDSSSYKWTLNDTDITARDVHAAIGTPSIFRLRYGWLCDSETKSSVVPLTSIPFDSCLQSECTRKGCSTNIGDISVERKEKTVMGEEFKPITINGANDVDDNVSPNRLVEPKASVLWDNSLTNTRIGALLSETSVQGIFKNCDPKSNWSNAGFQPSQLISDSFDAFISAQINCSEGPRLPTHVLSSSILDAEDTCHAFPLQKISSPGKDAQSVHGGAHSATFIQDGGSDSFKCPKTDEASIQDCLPQSRGFQESETDLSLRVYHDDRSLGLSGIKWTESLGPFDLGLSSSRKIIPSDSLSISRVFK